ncbi:MAG TPA: HIT family protein [Candidatus Izemoplasmatales bacterium]|nr:HIT family protein [Candidatus Izemoplasmatales bacterium]
MDCIFCKIIKGDIPSYKVYEDKHIVAFLDISQLTKGHTLVLPKNHVKNIYELDEETASRIFKAVPKIARALKRQFNPIGMNIINNADKPLQSVFHFHIHFIPRYENDDLTVDMVNHSEDYSKETLQTMAQSIEQFIKE